ncbi:MAG: hypothetical protein WAK12_00300 [Acidimicrobiales bacterium]
MREKAWSTVTKVVVAVLAVGLCVVASGASRTGASSSNSTSTAKEILAGALAAAQKESGCKYTTTFSLDGYPYTLVADAGSVSGEQLISARGATIDLREVDGGVYVYANAQGVKLQYGVTDSTWANRWILVTSHDKAFTAFSAGVLLRSVLEEVPPATIKGSAKSQTVGGQKVVAITGKPNKMIGLSAGKETLYLSATAPYLPVKLVVTDKPPSEVRKLTFTFSHWGESFVIAKPSGATPISNTNLPD